MPYKEKHIEKKYYSIGEVAQMFDVAPSLIRFWEAKFDCIKPKKNRKGNRIFTAEDIENIRTIYKLVKEKGYTLQGAQQIMQTQGKKEFSKQQIIATLHQIKAFLNEIDAHLS